MPFLSAQQRGLVVSADVVVELSEDTKEALLFSSLLFSSLPSLDVVVASLSLLSLLFWEIRFVARVPVSIVVKGKCRENITEHIHIAVTCKEKERKREKERRERDSTSKRR